MAIGVPSALHMSKCCVFIHSLGLDATVWDEVRRHLPKTTGSIAVNLPGHGPERAVSVSFNVHTAAASVRLAVQNAGCRHPILVGLSVGGMVAQQYAVDFPGEAAGLVLIGTNFLETPDEIAVMSAERAGRIGREGSQVLCRELAERWLGPRLRTTRPDTFSHWASVLAQTHPNTLASAFEAIARSNYQGEYPPFRCPVLVLVGEFDPPSTHLAGRQLRDLIPESRLLTVPGAAHVSPVEQPEWLANVIDAYAKATWSPLAAKSRRASC
jgi:3-oxoadipate enol-lactonase